MGAYFTPSVVGNRVYLAKTGLFIVPCPKYPHRYLVFQQA